MGRMQREKGKRFERFIADELRKALPEATVHRTIQAHAAFQADVTVEGLAPRVAKDAWLELTDAQKPDVSAKLAQAERDAEAAGSHRLPIVVWKKSGSRSVYASLRLSVLGKLLGFRSTSSETEMVTIGWPVILAAFSAANEVRKKMDGVTELAKTTQRILAEQGGVYSCKAPPASPRVFDSPGTASDPPKHDHHPSPNVPQLTYVETPAGFPDHRLIAGRRWEIRYSPNLLAHQDAYGATYSVASLIVLDSTCAPSTMRSVLLHELLHACFSTAAQNFLTNDEEESTVRLLTAMMISFLPERWWA